MLSVDQIEEWLGQEVLDADDERVGKLDEVFYSGGTGDAVFATIKSGLLGRHSNLVPLAGASVGRDYLRLAYSAEQIERASSDSGVDAKDTLDGDAARRLGAAFGIEVAQDDDFESATVLNERRRLAEEAGERAGELDEQARRRAAEAAESQNVAQDAQLDAEQKSERAESARIEAEQARSDAQRLTPPP